MASYYPVRALLGVAVLVALLASGCGGGKRVGTGAPLSSWRAPTASERRGLERALSVVEFYAATMKAVRVLRAAPTWAAVECSSDCVYEDRGAYFLMRRGPRHWHPADWFSESRRDADYFCAYAPPKVLHGLFGITCPPARDVRARRANEGEQQLMLTALSPSGGLVTAGPTCVSRLNPAWAGGYFTGSKVWDPAVFYFRRAKSGPWRYAWGPPYGKHGEPPGAVLLSLESCVDAGRREG